MAVVLTVSKIGRGERTDGSGHNEKTTTRKKCNLGLYVLLLLNLNVYLADCALRVNQSCCDDHDNSRPRLKVDVLVLVLGQDQDTQMSQDCFEPSRLSRDLISLLHTGEELQMVDIASRRLA